MPLLRKDQRILRGAEIIKSQLKRRNNHTDGADSPQVIREESERICEDLLHSDLSTIEPAGLQQPILSDKEAAFEDVWGSPMKHVKIQAIPVRERSENDDDDDDAARWADKATPSIEVTVRPGSPTPSESTPVTTMGRQGNLRIKKHTYIVENYDDGTDESVTTYDFVDDDYDDDEADVALSAYSNAEERQESQHSYLPKYLAGGKPLGPVAVVSDDEDDETDAKKSQQSGVKWDRATRSIAKPRQGPPSPSRRRSKVAPSIPATTGGIDFSASDPAYKHAISAGTLWQSIVGQHIRFPRTWFDGWRRPPLGCPEDDPKWAYSIRQTVYKHPLLNRLVRNRASPGRLLLHMQVLQDCVIVADVAIGCFHPNARGIRISSSSLDDLNDSRDVWMGIRQRVQPGPSWLADATSVIPSKKDCPAVRGPKTPLPGGKKVTNLNVRVIFGEEPPVETALIVPTSRIRMQIQRGEVMGLLQDFVFS